MTDKSWAINKQGTLVDRQGRPFVFEVFTFEQLVKPRGFLEDHPACFALFYYTILIKQQKLAEVDPIQYDDVWPVHVTRSKELFLSISMLYSVTPEAMLKFWKNVDLQCLTMGSPKVPADLRHDKVAEIRTQ